MSITRTFALRWSDADANGHVRHTVYAELAVEARMAWLTAAGFGWKQLTAAGIGPVLLREEIDYRRELALGDAVTVDLELVGLSPDGARWRIRHTLRRGDGDEAARVVVYGGWLDLAQRRLVHPPEGLGALMASAPRAGDYADLPPLRR